MHTTSATTPKSTRPAASSTETKTASPSQIQRIPSGDWLSKGSPPRSTTWIGI
ncbi:hypothetical protein LINGRAHAP2_LOCUS14549 [Linum grandiflorum]